MSRAASRPPPPRDPSRRQRLWPSSSTSSTGSPADSTEGGLLLDLCVREREFRRPIPGPAAGGMMTARRMAMVVVGVLALSVVTAAQSKGKTKAQGKVVDEAGQPLGDVIVAAVMEGQDKPFQQAKKNNKGE